MNKTVLSFGLTIKSLYGILIVMMVGLPRILKGEILYSGFMGIFVAIALGIMWYMLFSSLAVDKGFLVNFLVYTLSCVMLGWFFSHTIVVSIYYISFYGKEYFDVSIVNQALAITSVATMVAVLGGIFVLTRITLTDSVSTIGMNFIAIFAALTIGYILLFGIAFILSIFGLTFLFNALTGLIFGVGLISIGISIIMVIFAEMLFLAALARVKMMIGNDPKYLEYMGAMILVNAVVQIFVELFKLVLKLLIVLQNDRR